MNTKTLSIKARVYNKIRTALYKKTAEQFTDKQKIEFFDKIFQDNHEAHWELVTYKRKRKEKARVEAERKKRGAIRRKKISKEEYLSRK